MTPQTGLCQGCARTIDEIIGWSSASEAVKRDIWLAIGIRRASGSSDLHPDFGKAERPDASDHAGGGASPDASHDAGHDTDQSRERDIRPDRDS